MVIVIINIDCYCGSLTAAILLTITKVVYLWSFYDYWDVT